MKKILLTNICFLASIISMQAQTLYVVTGSGGPKGGGTIVKYIPAMNSLTVAYSFGTSDTNGNRPSGKLLYTHDKKIYGVTLNGGSKNLGVLYSFDPLTSIYSKRQDFDSINGSNPNGSLVQASDGKLYGMCRTGGKNNLGVIYSFDPATSIIAKLIDFEGSNGSSPGGALVQATNGLLYGMTPGGGVNNLGVIFSFDPAALVYTKLWDFEGALGRRPGGSLLQASDGKLYGTAAGGGLNDCGVIFSFDPISSVYTKLVDIECADNFSYPACTLIQATDGLLYGTNMYYRGQGVIFTVDPATSHLGIVGGWSGYTVGAYPSDLMQASDGKLYGTMGLGPEHDDGTNDEEVTLGDGVIFGGAKLMEFDYAVTGRFPSSTLIEANPCDKITIYYKDADGDGYGDPADYTGACSQPAGYLTNNMDCNDTNPAVHPGAPEVCNSIDDNCNGQVDEGFVLTTYYPDADADGYGTGAGLSLCNKPGTGYSTRGGDCDDTKASVHPGAQGNCGNPDDETLYGVTYMGGNAGWGTINKFIPATNNLIVVHSFLSDSLPFTGLNPFGSLVQADDGKLYGMTSRGGTSGYGVIFSFDPYTYSYTNLKSFDGINGASPQRSLIQASDGKLYGMTQNGGRTGRGVIFSFDPVTSVYTKHKDFEQDGDLPQGSLIQASDGKIYGMTSGGGLGGYGGIFSFDPSSSIYISLLDFATTDAIRPLGSFVQATDGKLYGMTSEGGSNGAGVIFSFDPSSSTFTKLKDFDNSNGRFPHGSLIQAKDGKLYGMTMEGGSQNRGVIFSFDPVTSIYLKLKDFDGSNGANTFGDLMQASDGKLYGMTNEGGGSNLGVILSLDPSSYTFTQLIDFVGANGANPASSFIEIKQCNTETTYYNDADGDGFGNPNDSIKSCNQPTGYIKNNTDCNDTKSSVHPGAPETCGNGIDDNCNGQVDEGCNNVPAARINDLTVDESKGVAVLTVRLSKKTSKPIWILYYTKDGTAVSQGSHQDYCARFGLVYICPGSSTGTISIKIIKDNIPEPTEYFDIVLVKSYNATIWDGKARVFITGTIPGCSSKAETARKKEILTINSLVIKAIPNPTTSQFNLVVESNDKTTGIVLEVLDVQGKLIETRSNLVAGQTILIGGNYRPGTYFIQAVQGKQRKTISVIRL